MSNKNKISKSNKNKNNKLDKNLNKKSDLLLCVTGASGAVYVNSMIKTLLDKRVNFDLIFSDNGLAVFNHELDLEISKESLKKDFFEYIFSQFDKDSEISALFEENNYIRNISIFDNNSYFERPASGSNSYKSILVLPGSMGTVGKIASGVSTSLILRAIDVGLKENSNVTVCFREAPLNLIHLENLIKLKKAGVTVFPLSPSFYFNYYSIDDLIQNTNYRILNTLSIDINEQKTWE